MIDRAWRNVLQAVPALPRRSSRDPSERRHSIEGYVSIGAVEM